MENEFKRKTIKFKRENFAGVGLVGWIGSSKAEQTLKSRQTKQR